MFRKLFVVTSLAVMTACAGVSIAEDPAPLRAKSIAAQGYVFGFPILLMDATMQASTTEPYPCGLGGPVNSFTHKFNPPEPDFRAVVRPNVDTLYSSAFLDMSGGPMVLEVPEVKDRFYLMAMLDAWTNNFAGPGSQTNGGAATHYLIVGPDWQGDVPAGTELVQAPTHLVWIIGRTELKGAGDVDAANAIQRQYKLYPQGGEPVAPPTSACRPMSEMTEPEEQVKSMDGPEFFSQLDTLMERYPPSETARGLMTENLTLIGVGGDAETPVEDLPEDVKSALTEGIAIGQKALDAGFELSGQLSAWSPDPAKVSLGDYGDDFAVRGVVAQIGFGANRNEFATYQNASQDGDLDLLDGASHDYTLTFEPGKTPPVDAFWSVTVYDKDGFLIGNDIGRYSLGSNSGLVKDAGGATTILFASKQPAGSPQENWLPVPEGEFQVTLRMYAPESPILKGGWRAPPILKAED